MALPLLKLNLVPAPTLWRERHETLGWSGLVLGLLALAGCLTAWGVQAALIKRTGRDSIKYSNQAKEAAKEQLGLSKDLATLDIAREMPRWRLAERIYLERGLPWSRITAELERSLVDGVRTKAISRNRATDGTVELKIRGESRRREDEVDFIENLQENKLFVQVVLEREAERQGGGIDFELRMPLVATPPKYDPLPTPEQRSLAYKAKHGNSNNPESGVPTVPRPLERPSAKKVIEQSQSLQNRTAKPVLVDGNSEGASRSMGERRPPKRTPPSTARTRSGGDNSGLQMAPEPEGGRLP